MTHHVQPRRVSRRLQRSGLKISQRRRLGFKYFSGMETDPPTTMEEQFDAVLYLGPVSSITMSQLPAALCGDAEYTKMRLRRMALLAGGPTGPAVTEFHNQCGRYVRAQRK
jgi:hypothetical protein